MLSGEVYALKKAHEKAHTEACRLDKVLSGFDPTRRYEVFNEPMHAETLKRNEELAKEADTLERRVHELERENGILRNKLTEIEELRRFEAEHGNDEQNDGEHTPKRPRV